MFSKSNEYKKSHKIYEDQNRLICKQNQLSVICNSWRCPRRYLIYILYLYTFCFREPKYTFCTHIDTSRIHHRHVYQMYIRKPELATNSPHSLDVCLQFLMIFWGREFDINKVKYLPVMYEFKKRTVFAASSAWRENLKLIQYIRVGLWSVYKLLICVVYIALRVYIFDCIKILVALVSNGKKKSRLFNPVTCCI